MGDGSEKCCWAGDRPVVLGFAPLGSVAWSDSEVPSDGNPTAPTPQVEHLFKTDGSWELGVYINVAPIKNYLTTDNSQLATDYPLSRLGKKPDSCHRDRDKLNILQCNVKRIPTV
jgi:hypothetical protein